MNQKYFIQRDKTFYTKYTKDEIRSMINPYEKKTFLPILQDMNYPYIDYQWKKLVKKAEQHTTSDKYSTYVIGRYIALMKLRHFSFYTWEDSNLINQGNRESGLIYE